MKVLSKVASALFVLSLPVLFGTISLRWLVSDVGWYRSGFEKYKVSVPTGMSMAELNRAATEISRYLLLERDDVDIPVAIGGTTVPLFNARETKHMEDVRNLLRGFYTLQFAAACYALSYLIGAFIWLRHRVWAPFGRMLKWGGGITIGLFSLFGVLSFLDFDELFLRFHLMSFDNDLWILDPAKDRLIMMFPQGFWYDSAIRLALATGAQAFGALLVGSLLNNRRLATSKRRSAK